MQYIMVILLALVNYLSPEGYCFPIADDNYQDAFQVVVQIEQGERSGEWGDYHEFVLEDGIWCDVSRPTSVRSCQTDVIALLDRVYNWCSGEFIPALPEWADWKGQQGEPGYTSIDFLLDVRYFNGETASRLTLACDVSPTGEQAVCLRRDRVDHFNFIMMEPLPILALVGDLVE